MKRTLLLTLILTIAIPLMAFSAFAGKAQIRMEAKTSLLQVGQEETIKVVVNTPTPIGAYQFAISSDSSALEIVDVQAGPDGVIMAASKAHGLVKVNGFDVDGKGPGELDFLLIKVKAKAQGKVTISVKPVVFADVEGQKIPVSGSSLSLSIE